MYKPKGPHSHFMGLLSLLPSFPLSFFHMMGRSEPICKDDWICHLKMTLTIAFFISFYAQSTSSLCSPIHFPLLYPALYPSSSHSMKWPQAPFYSLFITKLLSNKSAADGQDLKTRLASFPLFSLIITKTTFQSILFCFVIPSPNIAYNKGFELSKARCFS